MLASFCCATLRSSHSLNVVPNANSRVSSKYPVYIGKEILHDQHQWTSHISGNKCIVVSNDRVFPLHGKIVCEALARRGIDAQTVILRDGEEQKTYSSALRVLEHAIRAKMDRSSSFVSVGGGVISDITGFAASIYQRGVPVVHIPTTLMGMVDASLGGKTAVNHAAAKNIIGTFHSPACVVMDVSTLSTLPRRGYVSGIAEMIKHGLIHDATYFEWLEVNMPRILRREEEVMMEAIRRSCDIKLSLVEQDECDESGVRALLNLGHTFGHALETLTNYTALLHGEAVAVGIATAADVSLKTGFIDVAMYNRILRLLKKASLPTKLPIEVLMKYNITANRLYATMVSDKKTVEGVLHLVLLRGPLGSAELTNEYNIDTVIKCLSSLCSVA